MDNKIINNFLEDVAPKKLILKTLKKSSSDIFSSIKFHKDDNDFARAWEYAYLYSEQRQYSSSFNPLDVMGLGKEKIFELYQNGNLKPYLDGLYCYLKLIKPNEIETRKKILNFDLLYVYAITFDEKEEYEFFSKYRSSTNLINYKQVCIDFLSKNKLKALRILMNDSDNHNFNHSELLLQIAAYQPYPIIKEFVDNYGFDINAFIPTTPVNYSLAHYLFVKNNENSSQTFKSFIHDYVDVINFNTPYKIKNRTKDLLQILSDTKEINNQEKIERLNIILKTCSLTHKHYSQLANIIFSDEYISKHYDHEIYGVFFKHILFKDSTFNKDTFLNSLFLLSEGVQIRATCRNSNNTINPIRDFVKLFLQETQESPLNIYNIWKKSLIRSYGTNNFFVNNKDIHSLIINHEKNNISKIPVTELQNTHSYVKNVLIQNGIDIPKKIGFIQSLFQKKKKSNVVEVEKTENEISSPINYISFNEEIYTQVIDSDIKRYIDSIQLNYEQFILLVDIQLEYQTEYYIKNRLPKDRKSVV